MADLDLDPDGPIRTWRTTITARDYMQLARLSEVKYATVAHLGGAESDA